MVEQFYQQIGMMSKIKIIQVKIDLILLLVKNGANGTNGSNSKMKLKKEKEALKAKK